MSGISAALNGPTPQLFRALAESDEEGEALYQLNQSRQTAGSAVDYNGMEPGDLMSEHR